MKTHYTIALPDIPPAVKESYADLRRDPYLEFRERYRRYANFKLRISGDGKKVRIARMAHRPYYQGKKYHETLGGLDRNFEPIEADVTGIIAQCSAQVPLKPDTDYLMRVHQFRTVVRDDDEPGKCVPEGPHRDGVDYAVMVSIDRRNIEGGASQILKSKTDAPCFETVLEPGTALVVRDTDVFHNVTDIALTQGAKDGHRDVLLWGYIPWEVCRYRELYGDQEVEVREIEMSGPELVAG